MCRFSLLFVVVRTTQQSKIPGYYWATLLHGWTRSLEVVRDEAQAETVSRKYLSHVGA